MSVQHKKNFTKLDNQDHILVKKGLVVVARRFLETRKVRLRDGKVFFLFIRILFFSKNATYFVIDHHMYIPPAWTSHSTFLNLIFCEGRETGYVVPIKMLIRKLMPIKGTHCTFRFVELFYFIKTRSVYCLHL